MANYNTTKASIDANVIPYNNAQLITGEKMNFVLKEIVDNMGGQGYLFKGIASPSDPAITTDARVFFFATEPGTYTNKGGVVVNSGELAIITYDTIWNKSVVNYGLTDDELAKLQALPTNAELTSLLDDKVDKVSGKGLSSNDYTDADKAIVDGVDATYAKKDGYYSQMGVGVADNLAGKGDGVPAEFTRRTTGGDASVADGVATLKAIKGKTIVWNQLLDWLNPSLMRSHVSFRNNRYTIAYAEGSTTSSDELSFSLDLIEGHTYLCLSNIDTTNLVKMRAFLPWYSSVRDLASVVNEAKRRIFTYASGNYKRFTFSKSSSDTAEQSIVINSLNIFDLTLMFGAGNEPSTVEEFEALFPNIYYPYNAGQLLSFKGTDIVTDGFNQWDEEWEVGGYMNSDGSPTTQTDRIRSKPNNFIEIFPNTAYSIKCITAVDIYYYDSNKEFISYITKSNTNAFITPTNAKYIRFATANTYGTTYNHDICINLSWSGYRNGEYEPYWKETKDLPSLSAFDVAYTGADGEQHTEGGLKSAGTAYDEQTIVAVAGGLKVKNTRRIGVEDLGNLTFARTRLSDNVYLFVAKVNSKTQADCLCSVYSYGGNTRGNISNNDKRIGISNEFYNLAIRDDAYTDAATFKAAMAGVLLFYELADPVETDGEVYNPNYRVSDFGTETILPEGVDEAGVPKTAPFNGSIVYGLNAVDTLRNLPKDYISKDSMDAILAAFVSAGIIAGYTLTFDATSGKYTCTITPNAS